MQHLAVQQGREASYTRIPLIMQLQIDICHQFESQAVLLIAAFRSVVFNLFQPGPLN